MTKLDDIDDHNYIRCSECDELWGKDEIIYCQDCHKNYCNDCFLDHDEFDCKPDDDE